MATRWAQRWRTLSVLAPPPQPAESERKLLAKPPADTPPVSPARRAYRIEHTLNEGPLKPSLCKGEVPAADEDGDSQRSGGRRGQRQNNPPEDAELPAPINLGRIKQLNGYRAGDVLAHPERAKCVADRGDNEGQKRVRPTNPGHLDVPRDQAELTWNEHRQQQHPEELFLERELIAGECVPTEGTEEDGHDRRADGDNPAVEHRSPAAAPILPTHVVF